MKINHDVIHSWKSCFLQREKTAKFHRNLLFIIYDHLPTQSEVKHGRYLPKFDDWRSKTQNEWSVHDATCTRTSSIALTNTWPNKIVIQAVEQRWKKAYIVFLFLQLLATTQWTHQSLRVQRRCFITTKIINTYKRSQQSETVHPVHSLL